MILTTFDKPDQAVEPEHVEVVAPDDYDVPEPGFDDAAIVDDDDTENWKGRIYESKG